MAEFFIHNEIYGHKKARRPCGLRALCTSPDLSGNNRSTYLVELGGFEPPSEITTPLALHA